MIPHTSEYLKKVEISQIRDPKYKNLLNYTYKEKLMIKTRKVYDIKTTNHNYFAASLCCDFKELENSQPLT